MASNISRVCKEARIGNNLQFFLADMFELVEMMVRSEFNKAGFSDKPKVATIKNMIRFGMSDFRKITRQVAYEDQISFGDSSEKLLKLLILVIDRSRYDISIIDEILSNIEKIESKLNIDLRKFGIYN